MVETTSLTLASTKGMTPSLAESVVPGQSKRTEFPLLRSKVAFLIIDIQKYLSQPSSVQEEEENSYFYKVALPRTVANIERMLKSVRRHRDEEGSGCEVVFVYLEALTSDCRDLSLDYKLSGPQLAALPSAHSSPAKFLESVRPIVSEGKGDICIPKTSCSVFMSTNLNYVLRNLHIEQLVVCGQLTDQCVESAVRDAADLGYFVSVVEDACAAKSESSHNKGLHGMKGFSRIVTTEQVIEELRLEPKLIKITSASSTGLSTAADVAMDVNGESTSDMVITERSMTGVEMKGTKEWNPPGDTSGAVTAAMLRALQFAGVKFLRFLTVDACNSLRCKVVPLYRLLKEGDQVCLVDKVTIAEVCFAGLPTFGDYMTEGTNLDARRSLCVHPDLSSLRILPYSNKTALVMGTAHDQFTGELSPLCTRGLLSRVLQTAEQDYGIAFVSRSLITSKCLDILSQRVCVCSPSRVKQHIFQTVGAEIEFCLHHDKPPYDPVDGSVFANTATLNEQEDFINDLYDQLEKQHIEIELLHSESGPGQLEVVLRYQLDPIKLADNVVLTRETIRAVARSHKMKALFLPKIHEMKAGNGMHVHLSFRDLDANSQNALPHTQNAGEISPKGKSFLEGILTHLPALMSLTMPTTNSFRRVGPGCWTGHRVCWAFDDKEVPLRVSADETGTVRDVELKLVDSTCNVYLALSTVLACGLDGIARELTLRPVYDPKSIEEIETLPSSLEASLQYLRDDKFLSSVIGDRLSTGYVTLREAEAQHSSKLTLEEEVEMYCQSI